MTASRSAFRRSTPGAARALALAAALAAGLCTSPAFAAEAGVGAQAGGIVVAAAPVPSGVVSLVASATVQTAKDWMSVTFSVTRDGADAGTVQSQIRQALEAALAEARKSAKPGAVEVAGGAFSLQPRYDNKTGRMNGWTGTTTMSVQGRDMTAIAQLVGRIGTMTVQRLDYGLSPEARERAENEASAQAIARYRAKAADVARGFGYARYEIREVNVQAEMPQPPRPFLMKAAAAPMADGGAMPVEAGDENVVVTVNGTVQLSR